MLYIKASDNDNAENFEISIIDQIIQIVENQKDIFNMKCLEEFRSVKEHFYEQIKILQMNEVERKSQIILNFLYKKVDPDLDFYSRIKILNYHLTEIFNVSKKDGNYNVAFFFISF